ncbi:MAG: hypothetical protein ACLRMZ_10925 [Blautia marasmi]
MLESVELPEGLTTIYAYAFENVLVSPAYTCQTALPRWAIKSLEAAAILPVSIIGELGKQPQWKRIEQL